MFWHPSRQMMFAYAERMVDKSGPLPVDVGRHIAQCARCAREVEAIRTSLMLVAETESLEPTEAFTSRVLAAARVERRTMNVPAPVHSRWRLRIAQTVMCAAGLIFVGFLSFRIMLSQPDATHVPQIRSLDTASSTETPQSDLPSPDRIRKAESDIRVLTAAMGNRDSTPKTLYDWQRQRAAQVVTADLAEALDALERYPGNPHAEHMVQANLVRQSDTLKRLYSGRSY